MREVRRLTADDLAAAQRVRFAAYGQPDDVEAAAARFAPLLPHTLGSFQGGALMSVATMLPTRAHLGGRLERFGALAGVATAPEARRRGHVAALIQAWFEELHDGGVGFSGEFPFDLAYYNRFGYQTVRRGKLLEVPISRFAEYLSGSGHAGRRADAVAVDHFDERVKAIFETYVARYDFTLERDEGPPLNRWSRALTPFWSQSNRYTYLVEGGYLSVHLGDDDVMTVRDFAWQHPTGRAEVLAFIAALAGNYEKVRLFLPPDEPLLAAWEDTYAVATSVYQLRIVDLERALSSFRCEEERRFRLRLVDAQCPWNDGVFDVTLAPQGNAVRRASGADAEVALDQRSLVALICGDVTAQSLLLSGGAEGDVDALRALSDLRGDRAVFLPDADGF